MFETNSRLLCADFWNLQIHIVQNGEPDGPRGRKRVAFAPEPILRFFSRPI
jgi:hypothetical protein